MAEKYPLHQLMQIKQKRLEEAEKTLIEKRNILEEEEKLLETLKKKRNEIQKHRDDKMTQLHNELDKGTTSNKIEQAHRYIQVVEEKLKAREKKVSDQLVKVQNATRAVKEAKELVLKRQIDMEKITIHKEEWNKDLKKEKQRLEGVESDELGSAMFARRQKKK